MTEMRFFRVIVPSDEQSDGSTRIRIALTLISGDSSMTNSVCTGGALAADTRLQSKGKECFMDVTIVKDRCCTIKA